MSDTAQEPCDVPFRLVKISPYFYRRSPMNFTRRFLQLPLLYLRKFAAPAQKKTVLFMVTKSNQSVRSVLIELGGDKTLKGNHQQPNR